MVNMSTSEPTFEDILGVLDGLVSQTDENIPNAPHQAFWRTMGRDAFVDWKTDDWGVSGTLVTPGNAEASVLYQALAGLTPFDGSELPQMPDVNADPDARAASAEELEVVKTWIDNGAP